jgi:anti-sigma regulatory factor (Ser/Thr protein kinase)
VAAADVVHAVVLAVSELVTNAVEHAGTSIDLRAGVGDGRLRVEVADGSGDLPHARTPDAGRLGGRGLHLVQQLADRWSVDTTPVGKTVWFERSLCEQQG